MQTISDILKNEKDLVIVLTSSSDSPHRYILLVGVHANENLVYFEQVEGNRESMYHQVPPLVLCQKRTGLKAIHVKIEDEILCRRMRPMSFPLH